MTLLEDTVKIMERNAYATKIVTASTELAYLPKSIDPYGLISTGDGGGLGVVTASQFEEGYALGLDIHAAIPDYYFIFKSLSHIDDKDFQRELRRVFRHPNVHLIRSGLFREAERVYDDDSYAALEIINIRRAMALTQGIGEIGIDLDIDYTEADKLFQLNDWPTALASPLLKNVNSDILTEMKWHNTHTARRSLLRLNKDGYYTKNFHKKLFFDNGFPSGNHDADMYRLYVDMLTTGFLDADQITSVGDNILTEALNWRLKNIGVMPEKMTQMLIYRHNEHSDEVGTVPNEPSRNANPSTNPLLYDKYDTENIMSGKLVNKVSFQQKMGLTVDTNAPIIYWPHRLTDPQKGSRLFLDTIHDLMRDYSNERLQIAFVANGDPIYTEWANALQKQYPGRIVIKDFDRSLSELGKAGSDFIMMPSLYEPRGLPQLEGPNYGTWTIGYNCVDGIISYDKYPDRGNGWVFNDYNHDGLKYAVGEAIKFYKLPHDVRRQALQRARDQNLVEHDISLMINKQIETWKMMLERKNKKLILREI
jgi:starch synthase